MYKLTIRFVSSLSSDCLANSRAKAGSTFNASSTACCLIPKPMYSFTALRKCLPLLMMVRSAYPLSSGDCLSSLACLSSKLLTLTVLMDDVEDVDAGTCSLMNLNNGDSSSILAYREVKSVE